MAEGYLIGPDLLGNIRKTIDAVDSLGLNNMQPTRIQTRFEEVQSPQQKIFRIGTFTGAWTINTSKTVSLPVTGSTSVTTVSATNLFASIATASSSRNCGIAKDGTAWYLIAAQCT
jgi:hypothetical protein